MPAVPQTRDSRPYTEPDYLSVWNEMEREGALRNRMQREYARLGERIGMPEIPRIESPKPAVSAPPIEWVPLEKKGRRLLLKKGTPAATEPEEPMTITTPRIPSTPVGLVQAPPVTLGAMVATARVSNYHLSRGDGYTVIERTKQACIEQLLSELRKLIKVDISNSMETFDTMVRAYIPKEGR